MSARPPRAIQAIAALFIPCACREEVLGDFEERCTSPLQYCRDAIVTVPLVILSRIRRTANPQLLLMHAFVLYLSFYGAAWFKTPELLYESWGPVRLAIPGAVTLLALVLEDAYAKPGHRSPLRLVRGPLLGFAWTILSQAAFRRPFQPHASALDRAVWRRTGSATNLRAPNVVFTPVDISTRTDMTLT